MPVKHHKRPLVLLGNRGDSGTVLLGRTIIDDQHLNTNVLAFLNA